MKFFKKLLSVTLSAAIAFTAMSTAQINVLAAGKDSALYTFFTESNMPTEPEYPNECAPIGGLGSNYNVNNWRICQPTDGIWCGFPSSAGKVYQYFFNAKIDDNWSLDEASLPETVIWNQQYTPFGMYFLWHTDGRWVSYTRDMTEYANTAVLTVKFNTNEPTFLDSLYVYVRSSKSGKSGYSCIKLSDEYYTAEDCGTVKSLCVPIKNFISGEDTVQLNGGFDPAYLSGAGFMFIDAATKENGWVAYDDLRICNVDAPKSLTVVSSTDTDAVLSWNESDGDIENYEVFRDGKKIAETSDTTYTDTTMEVGTVYEYQVRVIDKYGAFSVMSNSVSVFASPIGAPQNFNVESSFDDALRARLTWEKPLYGSYTGYNIYRDGEIVGEADANALSYEDEAELSDNVFYTYYIKAKNDTDESMPTAEKTVLVTYIGYPETVNLDDTSGDAHLTWSGVSSAKTYKVYRNGVVIAETDADTLEYTDMDRKYSTAYTYYICSVNASGKESSPSQQFVSCKDEPYKTTSMIFDDDVVADYSTGSIGLSTAELTTEKAAFGKKSYKINFSGGSFSFEGAGISSSKTVDLTDRRKNGGAIEFFVYAENGDMLDGVNVSLACASDKLKNVSYTARTGIKLSDYVKQYGYWYYVSVPISAFSATGTFVSNNGTKHIQSFKFASVSGIDFYTDEIHYMPEKYIYVDEVRFADFEQPKIESVTLSDGTDVASGSVISADTAALKVKFDAPMDKTSFEGNVLLSSDGANIPVTCTYDEMSDVLTVAFDAGLQKSTAYTLKFSGVKSANGVTVTSAAFDFTTNDEGGSEQTQMEDTEYINIPSQSVTKGSSAVVKLDFVSDKAAKTAVSAVDVTVTYDAAVLKTSADKISLSSTLKDDAKLTVNDGTINIKVEKQDNSKNYVLGSCIAQITFEALRAAGSEIAVSGTLTQANPEKSVKLVQQDSAKIVITTYDGGSGSGSGSGSKGGKRSEGTGGNGSIPVTDPTGGNNTADTSVFADLPSSHWAAEAVEYLNKQGIVNGYEDGTFRPNDSVTREEFTAMLVRAFANADSENTVDFKDADPNAWYYPYIVAAAQNGVVNGDGENFGVGRTITRQDMCAMLARIAKAFNVSLNGKYSTVIFDDESQIADYAKESVKSLQISGVVNGIGNGLFDPTGSVSRAMAAKALYGLMMLR